HQWPPFGRTNADNARAADDADNTEGKQMTRVRIWISRALDVIRRRQRDARLSEEMQQHLDQLTDENIARGMPPEEARFAARRAFGGVEQIKSHYRDQRGFPSLETWLQDVRFGFRMLRRDRGFTFAAVLVLGIGIGVNNMFFMVVHAHALRGLPMHEADRVLFISSLADRANDRPISFRDCDDLRANQRSFDGVVAFTTTPVNIGDTGRAPERFDGSYVTANGFSIAGVSPLVGRSFTPENDQVAAPPVVMLGASTWESRYQRDPSILERGILVNGESATVIGIVPDAS